MKIIELNQIKKIMASIDVIPCIEQAFVAYSKGDAVMPSVGELIFTHPPGDVHIKYGYIRGGDYYVIKVASGFYENAKMDLPVNNGLMLLADQKTGVFKAILLDEGYLTQLRTAAAGAIAAKYLAPRVVHHIGIVGTGEQARLQLFYLRHVVKCKKIMVWGRDDNKLLQFKNEEMFKGLEIEVTRDISEMAFCCNLIVTATPASSPLLFAKDIQPGTHITAIGADSSHKQELHQDVFTKADIVAVDSVLQCIERGDVAHAVRDNVIKQENLIELGSIIDSQHIGRANDAQITVADLTGLAVQDLQIAKAVLNAVS